VSSKAPVPIHILRRTSTKVEQIEADIQAHFINPHFDILPSERRGRVRTHVSLVLGDVRIDQFEPVGGELSGIGGNYYHLGFVTRGGSIVRRPRLELLNTPGGVGTLDAPHRPFSFTTMPGTSASILALTPEVVERAGRALLGDAFRLTPDATIDMRNAAGRILVRNATSIMKELVELEKVGLGQLAATSYSELLANLAIAAMYPEAFLPDGPANEAPRGMVGKAEEIIRARAHEPLTVSDVAAEVGVTVRALQLGFQKQLGVSPLQYLISRRLMMARERLLNPEFRCNVQYVAMSCGFMNMSKFSIRYRATFGELPSETLGRARRG